LAAASLRGLDYYSSMSRRSASLQPCVPRLTILLVEQNANAALRVSQRGYVMEVGGMVMDGPSDHLLESDDIKEFYLGKKEEGVRGRRRWKKRKTWR
jgi:branched-chain amino acid transport system ATP-binding protein